MDIDFTKPRVILTVGKCGKGKSCSTKYFILKNTVEKNIFQFVVVFSKTARYGEYSYIPESHVYNTYSEEILESYVEQITREMEENKDAKDKNKKEINWAVCFDDMLGLLSNNDSFLTNFFATHRHFGCTIFLNTQYYTGASTTLREITTHCLMFNSKGFRTIHALWENFGQLFDNFNDFKSHFLSVTNKPYVAMMFISDEDELEKNYVSFLAPDMSKINIELQF